ncbi:hypothetical protein ACHAPT_002374 [Fusarium lateritium]
MATVCSLGSVFDVYKGINTNLRKLDFKTPFHKFFYRWHKFVQATPPDAEEEEVAKSHYKLMLDAISSEMKPHIEQVSDMVKNNVISFQYVWALFEPDSEVYTKVDGYDCLLILRHGKYQRWTTESPTASGANMSTPTESDLAAEQ